MRGILCSLFFLLSSILLHNDLQSQTASHVVISEVYGGGGNSGALYRNDYVELYNPTSSPVIMTDWSIQYGSPTGGSLTGKTIFSGTIAARGFFLVQEAQGPGGTIDLPAPDAAGTLNFGAANGKVALASDTLAVTAPFSPNVVDFVGYGTANQYEGSGPAPALSNTTSGERKAQASSTAASMAPGGADELNGNGDDTNNNAADFVAQSSQFPQNSASPPENPVSGKQPPVIGAVSRSIFVPPAGGTDSVIAPITDADGEIVAGKLHLRVNGGADDSSIALTPLGGSRWAAVVPASKNTANGTLVEYFLSAVDDSSNYVSTSTALQGYFVGDAPVSSIKAHPLAAIIGYGVQVNGVINVRTNTHALGQGFMQDATGGIEMFRTGGLPPLAAARSARVQGPIGNFNNAYEINPPSFIDTTGATSLASVAITLPTAESPSNANEGKLVRINGLTTDSTGAFISPKNYVYRNGSGDTISIRIESNGPANDLPGKPIPVSAVDAVGILSYSNTFLRLKPRGQTDLGFDPADGTGTAAIRPSVRLTSQSAVAETLTINGDGVNTIRGTSIALPATWTWSDTSSKSLSGPGFASANASVSGDGSTGAPYLLTIANAFVTNVNPGTIILLGLNTPSAGGPTTFSVRTKGASGVLSPIGVSPAVNIAGGGFEAVSSGNWSSPSTWAGGAVPGAVDDVTMSTLGVVVTVDIPGAQCRNLTMTGSGTGATAGPVLEFMSTGAPQLAVNGNLTIGGGSGSGQGGRAKLTSNGNANSILIVKHKITTTSANSTGSGSAGLNMNEGTVKLIGATTDTLVNSAGLRLGDLRIGDGSAGKTLVWAPTRTSTLAIRSLTVKSGSIFWIGAANDSTANDIGNSTSSGVPTLTGGITIESGGAIKPQDFTAGVDAASINLSGGGITNDGTLNLLSGTAPAGTHYAVKFGGFPASTPGMKQTIGGSQPGIYADIVVGTTDTLVLQQDMIVSSPHKALLNGMLLETPGNTLIGPVEATRTVAQSAPVSFGGIGLTITAAGAAPGITTVRRVAGPGGAQTGNGHTSILRYFDISPATNAGLNASFDFYYDDSELAGQDATALRLWTSSDGGSSWTYRPGSADLPGRRLSASGINALSRVTAADTAHALGSNTIAFFYNSGWNMVSLPYLVPDFRKSVLFPGAVSNAFAYNGVYERKDTLRNGVGYWVKFAAKDTARFSGVPRVGDTVIVNEGWNMIGSIGSPVPRTAIAEIPGGIVRSQLFAYTGVYVRSDTVWPGSGYWVKTNAAGKLVLSASAPVKSKPTSIGSRLNSIIIQDYARHEGVLYFGRDRDRGISSELYELPPVPPEGNFDVRYSTQSIAAFSEDNASREIPIRIAFPTYPLTMRWVISAGDGTGAVLVIGQKEFELTADGSTVIGIPASDIKLRLSPVKTAERPERFALEQNYPNPFNPATDIRWEMADGGYVTIGVYDLLGRKVAMLVDEEKPAGKYTVEWDGTSDDHIQLSGGVYFVRMESGSFSDVKKIALIK